MQVLDSASLKLLYCPVFHRSVILSTLLLYGTKDFKHQYLYASFYFHLIIYLDLFDTNNYNLNSKYSPVDMAEQSTGQSKTWFSSDESK